MQVKCCDSSFARCRYEPPQNPVRFALKLKTALVFPAPFLLGGMRQRKRAGLATGPFPFAVGLY
jgi:hypothetical protein